MKINFIYIITIFIIILTSAVMFLLSHNNSINKIDFKEQQEVIDNLKNVLLDYDNKPENDVIIKNGIKVYTGKQNGKITGYAVNVVEMYGNGGLVSVLTGVNSKGVITGVSVIYDLTQEESSKNEADKEFINSFKGLNIENIKLLLNAENNGNLGNLSSSEYAVIKAVLSGLHAIKIVLG